MNMNNSVNDSEVNDSEVNKETRHLNRMTPKFGVRRAESQGSKLNDTSDHFIRLKAIFVSAERMKLAVPRQEKVDIKTLHTAKKIWGAGASKSDPERGSHIYDFQKEAFMPFGNQPFPRPTKPQLASFLAVFERNNWEIHCHDRQVLGDFDRCDGLKLQREIYTDVVLRCRRENREA